MDKTAKPEAAQARLIDFNVTLIGLGGKPLQEVDRKTGEILCDWTLKLVCTTALNTLPDPDKEQLSTRERFLRGHLLVGIDDGDITSLSGEKLSLVKECIGKTFNPLIIKRAFALLDPADVPDFGDKSKLN